MIINSITPNKNSGVTNPLYDRVKGCRVVIEDASDLVAIKQKVLNQCQGNPHSASLHRKDQRYLDFQKIELSVLWPKMGDDKSWVKFEDCVVSKLHKVSPVERRLDLLCQTILEEGHAMFGFSKSTSRRVKGGPSHRDQHCIALVKEKNKLLENINSCSDPLQSGSLSSMLSEVRKELVREGGRGNRCVYPLEGTHIRLVRTF